MDKQALEVPTDPPRKLRREGREVVRSRSERRAWWLWFLPLLGLSVAWALVVPLFAPADEGQHVVRVVAITRGEFRGKTVSTDVGEISEVRVPASFQLYSDASQCFWGLPKTTPDCADGVVEDSTIVGAFTIAGRYPPLYSMLVAPPAYFFGPESTVYAMRLIAAVVCAAFFASAFVAAQSLGRYAVLGVAASVTPITLHLSGAVNPSGLEIASATALWSSSAALALGPTVSARAIARVTVAYVFLANTRSLSIPIALIALLLPLCLADPGRLRSMMDRRVARVSAWIIAGSTAVAVGWIVFLGRVPALKEPPGASFTVAKGFGRTPRLFEESVAAFGFNFREMHIIVAIVIWLLLWCVLFVLGFRDTTDFARIVLSALLVASVAFPIVISLIGPAPIYDGWQGRYSLPLWIGLPTLGGFLAAASSRDAARARPIAIAFATVFGVAQLAAFVVVARRYTVGTAGELLYVFDARWSGPVASLVLLEVAIVATVFMALRIGGFRGSGAALPVTQSSRRHAAP